MEEKYQAISQQVFFNGWITSKQVIQSVSISRHFDPDKKGYLIEFEGKDGGDYELEVIMNWVYPFAEVGDAQAPILIGAHMRHETSPCDLERSHVANTKVKISVKRKGIDQIIFPDDPVKCTLVDEPGRWLKFDLNEDCSPPYCTGDRFASFVNTMSWFILSPLFLLPIYLFFSLKKARHNSLLDMGT